MNFNLYGRYYDLLYADKDYSAEARYVANALRSRSELPVHRVLELGCGSGGHAAGLCAQGFTVTGIDRSAEMVAQAQARGVEGFTATVADITGYRLSRQFDAAVALFHVVSYLTDNRQLIACFQRTADHLRDGGLFLFDAWYTPAVWHQRPETRIKRMGDQRTEVTRLAEPVIFDSRNVVEVNYEILVRDKATSEVQQFRECHPMRHLGIPEVGLLARLTGFELLAAEEFLTGSAPSGHTWGVCFILKKSAA